MPECFMRVTFTQDIYVDEKPIGWYDHECGERLPNGNGGTAAGSLLITKWRTDGLMRLELGAKKRLVIVPWHMVRSAVFAFDETPTKPFQMTQTVSQVKGAGVTRYQEGSGE